MTQLYIHSRAEYWGCFQVLPINTRVSCHSLLQGIFPTQGSNLCLLLGRQILYHWATREAPHFLPLNMLIVFTLVL